MALTQAIERSVSRSAQASMKHAIHEFKSGLALAIRVLTTQYNVAVVFKGTQAGVTNDGKTIFLPDVDLLARNHITDDEVVAAKRLLMALRGYAWHEGGHLMETDLAVMKKAKEEHGPAFHGLLNSTEDIRMERRVGSQYMGVSQALNFLRHKWVWPEMVTEMLKKGNEVEPFSWFTFALQVMIDQDEVYAKHFAWEQIPEASRNYAELFVDECREIAQARFLPKEQGVACVYAVCERIWSAMDDDFKSASPSPDEEEGEEGEQPTQVVVQLGEEEAEEGQPAVRGKAVDEDGEDTKPVQLMSPGAIEEGSLEDLGVVAAIAEEVAAAKDEMLREVEEDTTGRPYLIYSREHDVTIKPSKSGKDLTAARERLKRLQDATLSVYGPVKRRLQHLLKVQSRCYTEGDKLEGEELDTSNLYQLALADYVPNLEPRVFQSKVQKYTLKDTAVGMLIDASGSMSGHKANIAEQTAYAFGECLDAANVTFGVWSFTSVNFHTGGERYYAASEEDKMLYSRWGDLHFVVGKEFNAKWRQARLNMPELFSHMAQNHDSEAVLFAGQELLKQKQARKVLFVLSDGMPWSGDGDYSQSRQDRHLHEVVRALRAQGVEVVGIGICTDSVQEFYKPAAVVVNSAAELPKVVLEQMKFLLLQQDRR